MQFRLPNSLHARIGLFCLALFLAVQLPTLWLAYRGNNQVATTRLKADLDHGTRTFRRILDERGRQLELATRVLASDFAFRKALATADPATAQTALENHAARLRADFGLVLSPSRSVVASTGTASGTSATSLATVAPEGDLADGRSSILPFAGRLVQVAVVPVLAPDPIGWAAFGYEIDQRVANDLKQLVDLEISFVNASEPASLAVSASTLPRAMHNDLRRQLRAGLVGEMRTLEFNGEPYATNAFALDERTPPRAIVFTHQSVALANAPFKRLTDLLTLLSVLGIAACALGSSALAGAIARPIRSLTARIEAMRAGESGSQVAGKLTSELQGLADSFNKLIETLRKRDAEIQHLAYFDRLTGLRNRLGFVEAASTRTGDAQLPTHAAVALFEVASSTQISSVLGHEVGDEVIRSVALRLVEALPEQSIVGRIGTDEFAALLIDAYDAVAHASLQRVIAQFERPIHAVNQSIDLRIDIGWAQLPDDGSVLATVMRRAEIALDIAKTRQRSPLRFDHAMEADTHTQFALLSELKLAIAKRELDLHYQPKVSPSGEPIGLEALVRWNHPRRGLVMPGMFISVAEQTGAVREITRAVVEQAIMQQAQWSSEGLKLPIAVNISARDLQDDSFPGFVVETLAQHRVLPSLLQFEITERALMDNLEAAERTLLALQAADVKVALDDYGTGYATLTHISRLPVSELKIDRSFVTDLTTNSRNYAIVLSTVQMGHRLNMKIVAEGVETEAELNAVRESGCDEVQGFYFARPMAANDVPMWIRQTRTNRTVPALS